MLNRPSSIPVRRLRKKPVNDLKKYLKLRKRLSVVAFCVFRTLPMLMKLEDVMYNAGIWKDKPITEAVTKQLKKIEESETT